MHETLNSAVADVWLKNISSGFEFCKLTAAQNTNNFLFSGLCLGFSMRCLYSDQRMWICSFHGAYHRDCHFYYFDIVSGFGPRLCSSRWGDICLFEKWQSSAKNAANFRVSTKTCPAYQFSSKSEKSGNLMERCSLLENITSCFFLALRNF